MFIMRIKTQLESNFDRVKSTRTTLNKSTPECVKCPTLTDKNGHVTHESPSGVILNDINLIKSALLHVDTVSRMHNVL